MTMLYSDFIYASFFGIFFGAMLGCLALGTVPAAAVVVSTISLGFIFILSLVKYLR